MLLVPDNEIEKIQKYFGEVFFRSGIDDTGIVHDINMSIVDVCNGAIKSSGKGTFDDMKIKYRVTNYSSTIELRIVIRHTSIIENSEVRVKRIYEEKYVL